MTALRARRPARSAAVRLRRWRADPAFVHLSLPAPRLHGLASDELRQHLDEIYADGARGVVTSALCVADQFVFQEAGFTVVERLHLLRRTFDRPTRRPTVPTRRGRMRDRGAILDVDQAAFGPFWQLDAALLADALAATPRTRLRVVTEYGAGRLRIAGYVIAGRTQARGYIQRLAVHPEYQGRGFGAALLADGLRWLSRGRVRDAVVNTQVDNARSLRLYQSMGFELQRHGLAVLRLEFGAPSLRTNGSREILHPR